MRRSPVAALAAFALLVGTAAVATAAPPTVGDAQLMPSARPNPAAIVADDAIYTLSDTPSRRFETQLFTRSLNPSDSAVELGAPTFIGRASGYSMAEHDGSLAYTAWDGHLALRAPDGSQTRPSWGSDELFSLFGPTSMSSHWLAAGGSVFELASGAEYDIAGLTSEMLTDYPRMFVYGLRVTDERAVWHVSAWNDETFERLEGIFTVELGEAGPVGEPIMLDGGSWGTASLSQASFTDDAIVWLAVANEWDWETYESTTTSSVRWVALDAVDEPYAEAAIGPAQWANGLWTYGTSVAVSFLSYDAFGGVETTLSALDLADLAAGELTLALPTFNAVLDVDGPVIAWTSADGKAWFTDTLAREITGAGSSPGVAPRGASANQG